MHPNTEPLPELPALPNKWNFLWKSTPLLKAPRRSNPLQRLDAALGGYGTARAAYETHRAAYERMPPEATTVELTKSLKAASDSYKAAGVALNMVNEHIVAWGPGDHDRRGGLQAVQNLWQQLNTAGAAIDNGWRTIDRISMSKGDAPVPDTIHQIWVGGVPGEDVRKSAQLWAEAGYDVNIWTDKNNLLASQFKSDTNQMGARNPTEPQSDPAIQERMRRWDGASPQDQQAGLDARLSNDASYLAQAQQRSGELQSFAASFPNGGRITVRDVGELFHPTNAPTGAGTLTTENREAANIAYQREIGERCNFAAASDLLRPIILHDHPGVYCDIDVTPRVNGMQDLISAWNGVVVEQLNQQSHAREQLPTAPVSTNMLERQRQKLQSQASSQQAAPAAQALPEAIDSARGMNMFRYDAYGPLLSAVEEHIDGLRQGATPGQPTPKYDALKNFVAPYDTNGHMMAAFDKWKGDNRSLDTALERLPPLQAPVDGFRALATSRESGANSNAVLASGTQGAPNLATYANALVENSTQQFHTTAQNKTDEDRAARRARYMNDAPASDALDKNNDYEMATLATTGPGALDYLYKTKAFGVAQDDPSIQLPHTYAGHFSSAEKNHSWLAAGNSPQHDDDTPSRSGPSTPGGSTRDARQRFPRPSSKELTGGSQSQGQSIVRPPSR